MAVKDDGPAQGRDFGRRLSDSMRTCQRWLLWLVKWFGPRNPLIRELKAAVRTFSRFEPDSALTSRALFRSALLDEKPRKKDDPSRNEAEQQWRVEKIHVFLRLSHQGIAFHLREQMIAMQRRFNALLRLPGQALKRYERRMDKHVRSLLHNGLILPRRAGSTTRRL